MHVALAQQMATKPASGFSWHSRHNATAGTCSCTTLRDNCSYSDRMSQEARIVVVYLLVGAVAVFLTAVIRGRDDRRVHTRVVLQAAGGAVLEGRRVACEVVPFTLVLSHLRCIHTALSTSWSITSYCTALHFATRSPNSPRQLYCSTTYVQAP